MASIVFAPALGAGLFNEEVMERTVKITHRNWTSIPDVCAVLSNAGIPPEQVAALQKGRSDGDGVTVVLRRITDVERLRSVEFHLLGERKFHVTPINKQIVFVRVHWLPVYASDTCVKHIMADYGSVLSVENAFTFHGKNNAKIETGVKIVKMEVSEIQRLSIPHIIKFECGNSALITGGGRPPLCLKCNKIGHMRRDCPHISGPSSYASAASRVISNKINVSIVEKQQPEKPEIAKPQDTTQEDTMEEQLEERPLVIDEGSDMETEVRGKKRMSEEDQVTDSFVAAFPPQKSMRPAGVSLLETSNPFSVLSEEHSDLESECSLDIAEEGGDAPVGLVDY